MSKKLYLSALILCFLGGIYVWKVTRTSVRTVQISYPGMAVASTLVYVGDIPIDVDDLDFEYKLHTKELFDSDDLKPKPKENQAATVALREQLLTSMIERRLLYQFLKKDSTFDSDDPSLYTTCLSEWQQAMAQVSYSAEDSERLKQRLCEQSVVQHYAKTHIFAKLSVDEKQVKDYYERHKKELHRPKRVLIRQIVVASEKEADEVMKGLTKQNFGDRAKAVSITPEAEKGGLIGPFAQGEMPKFFDYVFSMAKGEIYGNIKSAYGYHIFLLEEKYNKHEPTLSQAREKVLSILRREAEDKEYRKWIDTAMNAVPVKTINSKF